MIALRHGDCRIESCQDVHRHTDIESMCLCIDTYLLCQEILRHTDTETGKQARTMHSRTKAQTHFHTHRQTHNRRHTKDALNASSTRIHSLRGNPPPLASSTLRGTSTYCSVPVVPLLLTTGACTTCSAMG